MSSNQTFRAQASIRRHLIACLALMATVVVGIGGWAATMEIAGAVIAEGQLVVDSNVKKVQHATGGIVGRLMVHNGDAVKAGDVVMRLDDTQTKASLAIITKSLSELQARQAREEAERDGLAEIAFPPELLARRDDPVIDGIITGQERQFELRQLARDGQKAQLRERISQLMEEIGGLKSQESGKTKEITWIRKELDGVSDLWSKNLVQFTRLTALERDAARIEGEHGIVIASIAQARGKISELELQIMQIDQDMRSEVSRDLADIRARLAELAERQVAMEDQFNRLDLRAPQDGIVHQLDVHTVGGVVSPGQQVMLIVPNADSLTVEAKIRPSEIDQVQVGQLALLRFTALNQRTTPELHGDVRVVSPDVTQDAKTGANYYTVRVAVSAEQLARIEGQKLVPGMPVEAFLQTTPRTVLTYIIRPLHDQVMKALREK